MGGRGEVQGGNNTFSGRSARLAMCGVVTTSEAKVINDSTCPVVESTTYYSVFTSLLLGANAYGVTMLENGGLQHIVKQLGYGEPAEPALQLRLEGHLGGGAPVRGGTWCALRA